MNPYRDIFQAMNDAGVRYLVVGGVAVNLHGYSRFTGDIDVLLALDRENLERMSALMTERKYSQRVPVDVMMLSDRKEMRRLMKEKGLIAYTFIDSAAPQFSIDILTGDSLKFETFEERKSLIEAWGIPIPVVSIDDLIGMKKKVNRQKDAEDVAALLELKAL